MAKAKIETQSTVIVFAKEPIRYDGIDYTIGDPIDVTPECAAALEAAGAIDPDATA